MLKAKRLPKLPNLGLAQSARRPVHIYGPGSGQGEAQELGPGFWFICVFVGISALRIADFRF